LSFSSDAGVLVCRRVIGRLGVGGRHYEQAGCGKRKEFETNSGCYLSGREVFPDCACVTGRLLGCRGIITGWLSGDDVKANETYQPEHQQNYATL